MSDAAAAAERPKGPLDRFLSIFTEVRGGEGFTSLLLTLNVFLLLTTYYIIKPVREALILSVEGGAEIKAYAAAGQAALLLLVVPLYGAIASRVPRRLLITIVTLFFAACLVGFYFAAQAQVANLGVIFYLWVGIFNLMVIAQFWAFANDIYSPEQGKRLFAIVAFGASIGAVMGSGIASALIEPLGTNMMLIVSAVMLTSTLILLYWVEARERSAREARAAETGTAVVEEESIGGKENGFSLVFKDKYLLAIAGLLLVLNLVNTTGEYILGSVVSDTAKATVGPDGDVGAYIGKFYADFFGIVNIVGVVMQLFIVSRILKYFGVRIALMVLPTIALFGYGLLAVFPILSAVRWVKTLENATDYSLNNTVRQVLFLPLSREEKYKAKQAIDSFFVRAGDALQALLVFVGTTYLSFGTTQFALVNIVLVVGWLALAGWIGYENKRRVAATEAEA